jgi:hypothetical protein
LVAGNGAADELMFRGTPLVAAQWPRLDPAGFPQLLAVLLSPDGRVIAQRRTVVGDG